MKKRIANRLQSAKQLISKKDLYQRYLIGLSYALNSTHTIQNIVVSTAPKKISDCPLFIQGFLSGMNRLGKQDYVLFL